MHCICLIIILSTICASWTYVIILYKCQLSIFSIDKCNHFISNPLCLLIFFDRTFALSYPVSFYESETSISNFFRGIFPSHVKLFVENDAVAALASGTMGKLHGCVLIAGTGTIASAYTEDGREARAAGAGPILGDWGRSVLVCFSFDL